jgi:membrane associated rhomboid family serine protease
MSRTPRGLGRGAQILGARPSAGTVSLLAVEIGAFLLFAIAGAPAWVTQHLALTPRLALGREPWQLITSAFVHVSPIALVFDAITLWIFGTAVEQQLGRARMFTVFFLSQIAGSLAMAALALLHSSTAAALITGSGPGVLGLVAAFGAAYARHQLSLFGMAAMSGRTLALVVVGFSLAQDLFRGDFVSLAGTAVGAGTGLALATGVGLRIRHYRDRVRLWRLRRRYKVIPGGRDQRRYLN